MRLNPKHTIPASWNWETWVFVIFQSICFGVSGLQRVYGLVKDIWAVTCDFQLCDILTSVDSACAASF